MKYYVFDGEMKRIIKVCCTNVIDHALANNMSSFNQFLFLENGLYLVLSKAINIGIDLVRFIVAGCSKRSPPTHCNTKKDLALTLRGLLSAWTFHQSFLPGEGVE